MTALSRSFYARDTIKVARDLLGKRLVRRLNGNTISGIITETEAYRHEDDPASHAFRGVTPRNKAMFEDVGRAYVYFTYGMYYCVNAVARSTSQQAGAVLIRAIKPEKGIPIMIKNRKTESLSNLSNGPAKLTQALRITKKQYGIDLTRPAELYISDTATKIKSIKAAPRVGIKNATDKLWNFQIKI